VNTRAHADHTGGNLKIAEAGSQLVAGNFSRELGELARRALSSWYPCQSVVDIADQRRGAVPHYMPGENPFLAEFREQSHLPAIATRGGAETMYQEFQVRLKAAAQERLPK
jgi:hypothetical protein